MEIAGLLIRRERLRRSWSQEGLCAGLCSVSYLSKIEQGKARASGELLALLFSRLGLRWDPAGEGEAAERLGACRERLFSGNDAAFCAAFDQLRPLEDRLLGGRCALDYWLLKGFFAPETLPLDEEFEPFMEPVQLAMQRMLQRRHSEAVALYPAPFLRMLQGKYLYDCGQYGAAIEKLQTAYDAAAESGYAHIMLRSRLYMGNCHSDLGNDAQMQAHYIVAERLGEALGETEALESIRYNIAATDLQRGRVDAACAYFSGKPAPSALDLHKLAICFEKLGRTAEAASALDAAEQKLDPDAAGAALQRKMLSLVRFRLEQPDYLRQPAYGALL
ncbi:MAG: helix-turn-helix transcriptional regulator, partial [Clostridia bacterium]|nr:helix-turn-helix transcriptional regulator [Clostridia bacterium]